MITLITNEEKFGKHVENHIVKLLETLPRKKIASSSWYKNGLIIIIENITECIDIINEIAPEHLELCIENPKFYLLVRNIAKYPKDTLQKHLG